MKLVKYIIIILVTYLALSLTAARIIVSNAENNLDYFQNYLIENNITEIKLDKITSSWKGLHPSIKLFLINNAKDNVRAYPTNIKINFNIYKSVIFFKPVINEIYLEDIYYKTSVNKIIAFFKNKKFKNNIIVENIKIKKSSLSIKFNKKVFNINNANILIKKDSLLINTNIDNDKKFIANIKNFTVENSKIINFDYKIKISGNFNYEFNNIFEEHKFVINNSDLIITTSGNYSKGFLVKNKFSLTTKTQSNFILDDMVINNVNTAFILEGNIDENINFEINNLSFFSKNKNFYSLNNIAATYSKNENNISIFSKKLDINLNNFFNDYAYFDKNNIYFSGLIENFNLKFNFLNFYNDFYVSGNLIDSNLSSDIGYIKNFSGYVEGSNFSTFIKFNSKNVDIQYKSLFRDDKSYNSITGELKFSNYSDLSISVYDFSLINNDIDINITGLIDLPNDSIKIMSKIDLVNMSKITDYIPLTLMSAKSSNWFKKSFLSGYSKDAFILIDGNLSDYPFFDKYSGISYAVFPISKLTVDYKKNWIPFKNINGTAYFINREAKFYSDDFNILNTKAINAMLEIKDVKNIELILKGRLKGPFNDLLKYSNKALLTNIENEKVLRIVGDSETNFKFKIALNGTKNDYSSLVKLNNINFKIDQNNTLKNINGKILFKNNLFFTSKNEYIKARYNNEEIIFSLNTLKDNSFVVSGIQKIDVNKILPNKNYTDKVLGMSLWNYKLKIPGLNSKYKKIIVSANSDLQGTSINLPKPFGKNKDIKINISIDAFLENNKLHDINVIYNGIYAEISSFEKSSGYINFSGKKLKIPNNRFNLFGNLSVLNLSDWSDLKTDKDSTDYLSYINKINIKIDKLISSNIILDNVSVRGFHNNNAFLFNEIAVNSDKVEIYSSGKIEFNNISSFKVNFNSKNLEELLNYWKFTHSLRDSSINSDFDLSWQGGLFDFSLDKLYGEFNTRMTNGRLKKVGNRATRIFGLFNIDLLAKRLSLDFDDVTKNGFYFNIFNGDFRIESGNIFTTNLIIKGPSAEMLAVGTTDIINETYDMQVVASPEFGETLPAIALLGGPITAAATFAAEKLAKAFGKDINDLIKIRYKVSGSWDNPILKIIDKKGNALENVEDLFK